jgi:hypothetical protein
VQYRRPALYLEEVGMESPRRCPRCSSDEVIPIVYGIPAPDIIEEARAGRVALDGNVAWPEAPEWRCVVCGLEWRDEDTAPLAE